MVSIARVAIRGAIITYAFQGAKVALNLVAMVALARLIAPSDFGLVALALSIVGLGRLLNDSGLTNAALHSDELSHDQASNLFWLNALLGALATALSAASAPLLALIFGQPALVNVVLGLSTVFLWDALGGQFRVHMNREYRFAALNVSQLIPTMLGLLAALIAAYFGLGYWALIIQQQSVSIFGLVFGVALSGWWPGLPSRAADVRKFVRYGAHLLGTQFVAYGTNNVDSLALGFTSTPSAVGQYDTAFRMMMVPLSQLQGPLTRVALPTMARVRDNPKLFMAYARRANLYYCYFSVTFFVVGCALGAPVVNLLLGPRWATAGHVFAILAVGGCFRSLVQIPYWLFLALDLTREQLRYFIVVYPLIGVCIAAGALFGPIGVAIAHSLAYIGYWWVSIWWVGRLTGLDTGVLARDFARVGLRLSLPAFVAGGLVSRLCTSALLSVTLGGFAMCASMALSVLLYRDLRCDLSHLLRGIRRSMGRTAGGSPSESI